MKKIPLLRNPTARANDWFFDSAFLLYLLAAAHGLHHTDDVEVERRTVFRSLALGLQEHGNACKDRVVTPTRMDPSRIHMYTTTTTTSESAHSQVHSALSIQSIINDARNNFITGDTWLPWRS